MIVLENVLAKKMYQPVAVHMVQSTVKVIFASGEEIDCGFWFICCFEKIDQTLTLRTVSAKLQR